MSATADHWHLADAFRYAKKHKDVEAVVYYEGTVGKSAVAAFSEEYISKEAKAAGCYSWFKGSWAYTLWRKRRDVVERIAQLTEDMKRSRWW